MVDVEDFEQNDKSFVEDPAILDKFKAAAQITDGELIFYTNAAYICRVGRYWPNTFDDIRLRVLFCF